LDEQQVERREKEHHSKRKKFGRILEHLGALLENFQDED
jgi:hypothetical protein